MNKPWEVEGIGWREVRLEEVCQRRSENVIPAGENQIYVGLEHINSGEIKLNRWEYSNKVKSTKYKFYPDDILYGKLRPYLDKAVVSDKEGICSTDFIVIKPIKDKILPYYLVFFLHTNIFINYATSMMKGVHLPRVSWTIIKRFKIPLPFRNGKSDLETQKKIVEYIEANFSRIDKILEKKKKQLEQLDELWESILEHAFKPKEGEEWREIKLNEICSKIIDREHNTPKYAQEGIPLISPQNFTEDGFSFENVKYIDLKTYEKEVKRVNPEKGDILFSRIGTIGQVRIVNTERKFIPLHSIVLIKPKKEVVFNKYLAYFLITHKIKEISWKHVKKVGTPDLGIKIIRNFPIQIPFRNNQPDLEKQKEIANYLDSVYEKIKVAKEKIQIQINLLEDMKESILEGVFNHDEVG